MRDPYNLQRFVEAQQPVYQNVVAELYRGCKRTNWMWFVFPQIGGLGHSAMARQFSLNSLAEAKAYLEHPLLGSRLRECCRLVAAVDNRSIDEIFGSPDNLKFRSSMTLFALATADNQVFKDCLEKYFSGAADPATLARLSGSKTPG